MKIQELNEDFSTLAAGVKGAFNGKGTQKQLTQDLFLKDFYQDAITSLDNAIKGYIVNPNLKSSPDGDKPKDIIKVDPAAKKEEPEYYPVAESKFHKLNALFESIVEDGQASKADGVSISSYLFSWFDKYMQGVPWRNTYKPRIMQMLHGIEYAYPKGNWKQGIKTLGKAAYAISTASSRFPVGAKNAIDTHAAKPKQGAAGSFLSGLTGAAQAAGPQGSPHAGNSNNINAGDVVDWAEHHPDEAEAILKNLKK